MKNTFSLKNKQSRIILYLMLAIFAVISSFVVTGAWFLDREDVESGLPLGEAVVVDLVGTGEDGTLQNFAQLYDSTAGAYPGDKILDTVSVRMGEKTEESVLRVQFGIDILDEAHEVKTQNLTDAETNLLSLLQEDLQQKTTLFSSDWAQSGDWIYFKHLASGKANIQIFDEYSLPLPDSEMDNQYQELSFRISLVAEAIQAANILTYDEWNTAITSLSDSVLLEAVLKYNGERFSAVDEVLPYIEATGTQYIDTKVVPTLETVVEATFSTSNFGKWLFGSRGSDGAADTYAANLSASNQVWFQMQNNSTSSKFSTSNYSNKQTTIKTNKDAVVVDGTQVGTIGRMTELTSEHSIYLGALNQNGSVVQNPFVGKIYSAKIWDNGKLVRHFVPARDKDGNVGLYDLVSAQMFLNAGSGNFSFGHSIIYMANGGTLDASSPKSFVSGDLPITLKNPTREGYEFDGWFLTSDYSGAVQTSIPAGTDSNVYLFAKWIKTYNISYHLGGGINDEDNPSTFGEKTLPITLKNPTREGYEFDGWFSNPKFSGDAVTQIAIGTTKNISLWAKWNAVEKSVSYVLNGGTNDEQNVSAWTILDAPLRLYNPTQDGMTFEGWFTSSDFSGDRVTYLSKDMFGDVTLYAKWATTFSITYNLGGGLNDGRNPATFTKNTETITLFEPTRVNYTFVGWFDNEALSGTAVTQIAKGTETNIVLWAKWNSTQITVSFDAMGGSVSPIKQIVEKSGVYGDLPTPTKAGYTFDGWFDAKDDGTKITASSTVSTNVDHTLFAHWTENVYNITYNLDGGTNNAGNPETFSRTQLPISLLDATKSGAYFAGWYLDSAFTKRVTKIDGGTLKNVELWARFSAEPLVFDLVGSSSYSVRAANTSISGDIVIPSTYNGKSVVVVQNSAFAGCSNVTSVQIPTTVKSIGINVFENCTKLSSVTIPEGVTLVPNNAFVGCSELSEINLPTSVESIGASAFASCTKLTSVVLPSEVSEIGRDAFSVCSTLATVEAYADTPATIKSGVFPSSVQKIYVKASSLSAYQTAWSEYASKIVAFPTYSITYNLDGGTNSDKNPTTFAAYDLPLTLSNPTKENADFMGWYASSTFTGDPITEITTAQSVTLYARWDRKMTITYVLNGGTNSAANLTTISESMLPYVIEDAVWGSNTFLGWFNNSSFEGEQIEVVTKYGNITLYAKWGADYSNLFEFTKRSDGTYSVKAKSGVTLTGDVIIPTKYNNEFVSEITSYGFSGHSGVTSFVLPKHLQVMGSYAFNNCSGLTSIAIPSSVTSIGEYVFSDCNSLTAIEIPRGVTNIASYMFYNCNSLTSIAIPDSVTTIKYNAFNGCSNVLQIYIPSSVTMFEYGVFYQWNSSAVIYCGAESKPSGWDGSWNRCGSSSLKVVWGVVGVAQQNSEWKYAEKTDGTIAVLEYLGTATNISIPSSLDGKIVTRIYNGCFENNTAITQVTIPSSVTSMGSNAFYNCTSLATVTFATNSQLANISSNAFSGCSGLTKVNITDLSAWFNIDFESSDANPLYYAHHLYLNNTEITELTIPSGVTAIKNNALYGASLLTSITIPSGVTSIGSNAFQNCTGLTKVYIPSSVMTISASSYSYSPFYGCSSSLQIYCGASSKPSGWGTYWNYYGSANQLSVTWGAGGLPES